MYLELLLAFLLALASLLHYVNRNRRKAVKMFLGPRSLPIIGSMKFVSSLNAHNFLSIVQNEFIKYGTVVRYWVFNRLLISSRDSELNEQLLTKSEQFVKHRSYKLFDQWLGDGLLVSKPSKWRQRRKIITPAFHFNILKDFVEVFEQQSTIWLRQLDKLADGKTPFNVYPYVSLAALDIITETAMGTKVHAQSTKNSAYVNAVEELTEILGQRLLSFHLHEEWFFALLHPKIKRRQTKLINVMHEFTISLIEQRRKTLLSTLSATQTQNQSEPNFVDDLGQKKRMVLIDVLLQATIDGKPLTNEEIREEVDTFMFGGHDTVTSAVSHALYLLARHENVQEKLRAEVLLVLGEANEGKAITMCDLAELKYLECIIKETLRMYPSAPFISRKIQQDFEYTHSKFGKGVIPAGSEFLIMIREQNYDPVNFKEPTSFQPERHECSTAGSAFAMLPFSAGPRNCIGQKFAMLEMKTMLAKIIREFYLLPLGEDIKPEVNLVLRSSNGFQLGLKKRTNL